MRIYLYYHMLFIHSVPCIAISINLILSRVSFVPAHCKYLSATGLGYCIVNFLGVKYRGHVLYPFLPWTDFKSIIISVGIVVAATVIYMFVCIIVGLIKMKPKDHKFNSQISFKGEIPKNDKTLKCD